MSASKLLGGKVEWIVGQDFVDARGWLSPISFKPYDFKPVRAFIVSAPDGIARGGHGHTRTRQIFMLIFGRIEVEMSDGAKTERHWLDAERRAILVEREIWTRQTFHGDNAAMVVLCDAEYDPGEYFQSKSAGFAEFDADATGGNKR